MSDVNHDRLDRGRSILLREWTELALATADISFPAVNESFTSSYPADTRRSLALASDSYLSSALKVARSLADQICEAEDGDVLDVGQQLFPIPTPGIDWADRVVIHSSSNPNPNIDDDENETEGELQPPVAKFLPSQNNAGNGCPKDKMKRIYSLGIVFYQLFSGGEPPEITPQIGTLNQPVEEGANADIKADADETVPHRQDGNFDLGGELNINDDKDDMEEQIMPKKKRGQHNIIGSKLHSVSVEPLRLKGLPSSLCDLIANMVDCVNGDLCGEDAYRNISDVHVDLQLMLEKPNRFLHAMDLDKLSVSGLQLNEAMLDRDAEFSALKDSYRRSISSENELGIVVGPSGIGKSVLAHQLGSFIASTGGLFLTGKFDQLEMAKPFSALASAFNEYCDKISKEGSSNHQRQEVSSTLRTSLGKDVRHLIRVIPNLSAILGEDVGQEDEDNDCVDAQKRLQYLLCQFVDVISSVSGAPVTLFLDDLQWADPASINAIQQLFMVSGSLDAKRQFFFLGSCREEGLLEDYPFGNMLSNIRQFGVNAKIVELACMDNEMTNTLVSDLLFLSPRLTRSLSDIVHHKANGNLFFFSQLMISLYKDGLIRLSLSRRRWIWDEEGIQNRKLPDDVATFMLSAIVKLPKEVQDALCTLSCFGARSDCAIIEALETKLRSPLMVPTMMDSLDFAVAEGILDKIDGTYSFGHDRLQEAAYSMIKPEERCLFHFKYGVALIPLALGLQDDSILFIAASQINRGGPAAVEDPTQSLQVANLNLMAGHKAIEMSDFVSAFSFMDNGISFLPKRHWQRHYDLSLSLFNAASKCALAIGDVVTLKILSEQVLTFAQSFEDTLSVLFMTISSLADANQLPEAIEKSILVLEELGEELPESYLESETKYHIEQTKAMLEQFTDQQLVEYKIMEDPSKLMAMKFYAKLQGFFIMMKPEAQPIVTLKMVQLSIAYGMSPLTPIAFTYFGHLIGRLGDIKEGCRYVKIAKGLLYSFGSNEVAGSVIAFSTQLLSYVEPQQATVEFHVQGQAIAMAAGDTSSALFNSMLYVSAIFWSGRKLSFCKEQYAHAHKVMAEHGKFSFLAQISQMENNIDRLLTGASGDEDQTTSPTATQIQVGQDLIEQNPHAAMVFYFQKMYISFMLREYEPMKEFAEKYFDLIDFKLHSWMMIYALSAYLWTSGLVSFWVYRQSNDPIWASRGNKARLVMKKFAESSEWNFQQKALLLDAEEAACQNNIDSAKLLYEKAISTAREHRFINEEAISCELAGHFYLGLDEKESALHYFMQAHEKYHEWGAVAKSDSLSEFVQQVLGPTSRQNPLISSSSNGQGGSDDKYRRKRCSERSERPS